MKNHYGLTTMTLEEINAQKAADAAWCAEQAASPEGRAAAAEWENEEAEREVQRSRGEGGNG